MYRSTVLKIMKNKKDNKELIEMVSINGAFHHNKILSLFRGTKYHQMFDYVSSKDIHSVLESLIREEMLNYTDKEYVDNTDIRVLALELGKYSDKTPRLRPLLAIYYYYDLYKYVNKSNICYKITFSIEFNTKQEWEKYIDEFTTKFPLYEPSEFLLDKIEGNLKCGKESFCAKIETCDIEWLARIWPWHHDHYKNYIDVHIEPKPNLPF